MPSQLLPSQLLSSPARSGSLQGSVSRAGLASLARAAPAVPSQEEAAVPAATAKTANGASQGKRLSAAGAIAGSRLQGAAGPPKRSSSSGSPAVSGAGGTQEGAVPPAASRDAEQAAVASRQPGEPQPPAALAGSHLAGTGGEAGGVQSAGTEVAAEGEPASSRSASVGSVSEPAAPTIWSMPSGPLTMGAQTPHNDPDGDGPLGSDAPPASEAAVPAGQAGDTSEGAHEPAVGGSGGSSGDAGPTSQAVEARGVTREPADSSRAEAVPVSQAGVAARAAQAPAAGGNEGGTRAAAQAAGTAEPAAEPPQQAAVLSDVQSGAGRGGGEASVSDDLVGSLLGVEQQHAQLQLSAAQEPGAPAAEAEAVLGAADRPRQHHLQLPEVPAPSSPEAPRAAAQHLEPAESEATQLSRASSGVHQPLGLCAMSIGCRGRQLWPRVSCLGGSAFLKPIFRQYTAHLSRPARLCSSMSGTESGLNACFWAMISGSVVCCKLCAQDLMCAAGQTPDSDEQADEEGPHNEDPDDAVLMHSLGFDDEAVTGGPQVTLAAHVALLGTEKGCCETLGMMMIMMHSWAAQVCAMVFLIASYFALP